MFRLIRELYCVMTGAATSFAIKVTIMSTSFQSSGRSFASWSRFLPHWSVLLALPRVWLQRVEDRHTLSMLDDAQLRDIGLSRDRLQREITKPFWEA